MKRVLWIYIVYGIQNQITNMILCLFVSKKVFDYKKRKAITEILRKLFEWKGMDIPKTEVCLSHVHMLIEISPKRSISSFIRYLKERCYSFVSWSTNIVLLVERL